MRVEERDFSKYNARLNALSDGARSKLEALIRSLDWSGTDEEIEASRDMVINAMEEIAAFYGDQAATLAAKLYEQIVEEELGSVDVAQLADRPSRDGIEASVRTSARHLWAAGGIESFIDSCLKQIDRYVTAMPSDTILKNVKRDRKRGVRYARVPTSPEPCEFCTMLASRGFVYLSESSAGEGREKYHYNCRCRIVPGVQGSTTIAGYDPAALYGKYVEDLKSGKLNLKTVHGNSSHVLHWSSGEFEDYGSFVRFIESATDIEDLQQRCAIAASEWEKAGLSDKYWSQLMQSVMRKRSALS